MLKKVFITAAAAAAVSVPLAGAAWADPTEDNPGVPGNNMGTPPGESFSGLAKTKVDNSVAGVIREGPLGSLGYNSPGQVVADFGAPGHQ